jgi:hypothetical protein
MHFAFPVSKYCSMFEDENNAAFEEDDAAEVKHALFITQAAESGLVWALRSEEGYATSPSNDYDEGEVIPFWSDPELAKSLASDEWAAYIPTEVPMVDFLENWLVGMQQEAMLVGTNWDADLAGMELEPLELALELADKLLELKKDMSFEHFASLAEYREQVRQALEA